MADLAAPTPVPRTADTTSNTAGSSATAPGPVAVLAGAMSVGAGLVHAAVVGPHSDDRTLVWMFVAAAVLQCAVGLGLLGRPSRSTALAAAAVNLGCVAVWALSRTVGIGFVSALEDVEAVELTDLLAAVMAGIAVLAAAVVAWHPRRSAFPFAGLAVAPIALATILLTVPALAGAGEHGHSDDGGSGHAHGGGSASSSAGDDHADDHSAADGHGHDTTETTVAPRPFDPALPVDLSGTPGVTPEQQAWAEALLERTLERLPQWSDPAVAEAAGYRSIGDGYTGHEHFMLWNAINDDRFFDPDQPESLVYSTANGGRELVAAMYMLPDTYTLATVPDDGGALIQYHVHDDLCFSEGEAPQVVGITSVGGSCSYGVKFTPAPMFHVWITPHRCGPFAALEGIAGGQVREGEYKSCDHAHGSTGTF